ncbi:MAG: M15 family metallopeptidase, partial [Actinomycetes bacterium]
PVENPYLLGGDVLPPAGAAFADRSQDRPGMLRAGSPALQAFLDAGFTWGGRWRNPDYQHLQR